MSSATTIAEFGTSLAVAALGFSTGTAAVLVPVATLAATFAAIRHSRDPAGRAITAAQAALKDAPDFTKADLKADLKAAAAWLKSRPKVTLSPTALAAAHKGNLPAYLTQLLNDGTLPQDGATRRIIHLCLTAAHNAIRSDDTFHAPFTQDMLTELAKSQGVVIHKLDQVLADTADIKSEMAELKALLVAQVQRDQPQLFAQHTEMLIALARNYATGPITDFDSAYKGLENALRIYDQMRRDNALPHNAAHHLDAVLAKVQALNEAAKFDQARAELVLAKTQAQDRIAEETSGLSRILDRMVAQAALQNAPADAVTALLERLALDNPIDPFEALRDVRREWYNRYQSHAVPFDGQVALLLARETLARAGSDTQCGTAQNDLGLVLQIMGERAGDDGLLTQAEDAYRAALRVYTEDTTPQHWATTQNNLGIVLEILGQRAGNDGLLTQAVDAYRAALRVYSEDTTPQDWAGTQNNLGNVLRIMGQRAGDDGLLAQAVQAYRAALRVYSEDTTPQQWASIQNNLGVVLRILGQHAGDDGRLTQAVDAYRSALRVRSEKDTPIGWANLQNNLGVVLKTIGQRAGHDGLLKQANEAYRAALRVRSEDTTPQDWAETIENLALLDLAFFGLTGDAKHLTSAQTHATAARAVYARLDAAWYLQKIDSFLDEIARRSI